MTLPMVSKSSEPVNVEIERLHIELPLSIRSEHPRARTLGRHEEALKAKQRDNPPLLPTCSIWDKLTANSRVVVTGEAGCGKSTLLHWIANRHASSRMGVPAPAKGLDIDEQHGRIPIIIRCQDLETQNVPARLEDLLPNHLRALQFADDEANGCIVLTRERGLQLVVHQRDWIYELAVIADGAKPRRDLPPPGPMGRKASLTG